MEEVSELINTGASQAGGAFFSTHGWAGDKNSRDEDTVSGKSFIGQEAAGARLALLLLAFLLVFQLFLLFLALYSLLLKLLLQLLLLLLAAAQILFLLLV